MSVSLYPVALRWCGKIGRDHPGHGHMRVGCINIELFEPPGDFKDVLEIAFTPGIHEFRMRDDVVHEPRDAQAPEIQRLYSLMNRIATAVQREISRVTKPVEGDDDAYADRAGPT